MKSIYVKFNFIFMLLIFLNTFVYAQEIPQTNREEVLGFWGDRFPVPDEVYGYIFLDDCTYIYYDYRLYNRKERYGGSMGKWKIENSKIFILPEKDFYWENDWIEIAPGIFSAGDFNRFYFVKSRYENWHEIGDMSNYFEDMKNYLIALKERDKNKTQLLIPPKLMLRSIRNGKILSDKRPYVKLTDISRIKESYLQDVIDLFQNAEN